MSSWASDVKVTESQLRKFLRRYGVRFSRKGGEHVDEYTSDFLDNASSISVAWEPIQKEGR